MVADNFVLVGGNNLRVLPKEINVRVNNVDAVPELKMSPADAEAFLNARKMAEPSIQDIALKLRV